MSFTNCNVQLASAPPLATVRYKRRFVVPGGPIGRFEIVAVAPFWALVRALRGPGVVSPVAVANVTAHSYWSGPVVTLTVGAVVGDAIGTVPLLSIHGPTGPAVVTPCAVTNATAY